MKQSDAKKTKDTTIPTVSSRSGRSPRSYTFTVPTMPRPTVQKPNNHQLRSGVLALAFIAVAVISGFGGAVLENRNNGTELIGTTLSNQKKVVTSQSQLISQIVKNVGPSVVSVNVSIDAAGGRAGFGAFGFAQPGQEQAAGTGIIISSKGIIMTNRHVVPEGTSKVSITLSDGTQLKDVSVIGRTNSTDTLDIAFLKVNDLQGHKLTPAAIGNSSSVQVGDDVVAIGNALGQFQNTVTSGIISGFGRSVQAGSSSSSSADSENLDNLFQTDAAINEGNSGGPLVNLNGQVIGVNTAIAGNAQNIGFSIPINDISGIITQVLKTGKFSRPYIGVRYVPLTADIAKEYNLSVQNGAYIAPSSDPTTTPSVIAGSPGEAAGLQERDIITGVDGTGIDQTHSLTSLLSPHQPGDKVTVTVVRGDETKKIDVTLGTVPTTTPQG
jgi:serine protease Do